MVWGAASEGVLPLDASGSVGLVALLSPAPRTAITTTHLSPLSLSFYSHTRSQDGLLDDDEWNADTFNNPISSCILYSDCKAAF